MTVIRVGAQGTTVEAMGMGSCSVGWWASGEQEMCPSGAFCSKQEFISLLLSSAAARVFAAQHLRFGGTTLWGQIQC